MQWLSFGLSHESFWDQTPRTVNYTFQAMRAREERHHNERMSLAWHTAALYRSKKWPKLSSLLVKSAAPKAPQSWQRQMEIAKQWTAVLGGTVKGKAN